jgi:Cdc6-like AAA superfamily ATPase
VLFTLDYLTDYIAHFVLLHLAAQLWTTFGGDTLNLQKLELRLVSQCCSSSGCERNWSTFALIHTKVHNNLSFMKLHKLVYVNYNLLIHLQDGLNNREEEDLFHKLMELFLYDHQNPIREWMEHGRSNADPFLDEEDTESDTIPSRIVMQGDNSRTLRRITSKTSIID